MHYHPDMHEISKALGANIQELATALVGLAPSSKGHTEWRFRNRGSLAVVVAGRDRGRWFDHEAGAGGDALDLVAVTRRCSRKEAWRWGLEWLGKAPADLLPVRPQPHPPEAPKAQSFEMALTIWRNAVAPSGTLVEAYLISRGLDLHSNAPLRFHPACPRTSERLPAMIALMTDPVTNEPVGVHRTFLRPDGTGKADVTPAKMMLGKAGIIRLTPDEEVTIGVGITEGIENGLAVLQKTKWAPIWACGSAGGIARLPILSSIEVLTIFADADDKGAGLEAAYTCAGRWYGAQREVTIQRPPSGKDWLEALGVPHGA